MKRFRLNSIGNKLFIAFLAVLLIPSLCIAVFSYQSAKSKVSAEIHNTTVQSIDLLNSQIDTYMQSREQEIEQLTIEVQGNNPTAIQHIIDRYQKLHPEMETTYVGSAKTGLYIDSPVAAMPAGFDPRKRPWYIQAAQTPGQPIISAPFISKYTGNVVVSIAEMTPDKQYVVGTSLSLKALSKIVSSIRIGQTGTVMLLDGHNMYLYSAVLKAGTVDTTSPQIKALYAGNSGEVTYTFQGAQKHLVFVTNPTTGWKIAGTMMLSDESNATAPILRATLIVLIIAIILGGLVIVFVVRSITKPLRMLVAGSKKIGDGDLTERVYINRRDEFGQLGETFDQMRESLRSVLQGVGNMSQQVAASAEELMASSDQSAQAAQNIAETIQEVASGSERQATSVNKGSKVVQEMSGGIHQIAVNAQQVSTSSSESTDAVSDGQKSIKSVVEQMDQIHGIVTGLSQSIQKLNSRSNQIGDIVEVITQIASQTNLLSLNASIEAARAGEHGKGFAVVADEIRKLAMQSAQSAQDISELISAIQSDTHQAVKATASTTEAVSKGMGAVELAGQSFQRIYKNVTDVADQIQEVSAAVEEMSASSGEVTRSMDSIAEIAQYAAEGTQNVSAATEEQLATMEEINASATELARMAEELQEVIGRFTI